MADIPNLIKDLALILVVAGVVTLVFKKLKQPLVLGYIMAGFLVSPHMPLTMSVVDKADIQTWADIGVIFLLFSLGLDFSFKKILKMGMAPVIAACSIIFCMLMLGMTVGTLFGWGRMDCIFLGGMLAMSSTTIIYKAFDDLGLRQQKFAGLVMSVLILEDVLAIVMMVMLSSIATGKDPDGGQMLESILNIGYFLVLWFVVGIFLIPLFLRKVRKLMNNEMLVIVSLGLCFLMAVISTKVGFSSAFGAFVMGSILAETIEADKIIHLVEPIKNLFGAIFFVSVGMLVDPAILVEYAFPILAVVLTILIGQSVFGTMSFMFSGQSLKTAMKCGFSMAQIGEFAFIIASLGLSLGVISDFLYPVVVAVSVITTFITPYMIRAAEPAYGRLEKRLPKKWTRRLEHISMHNTTNESETAALWKSLLKAMAWNVLLYGIISIACVFIMLHFFLPFSRNLFGHWPGNAVCGLLTVIVISPFLRAMIIKKNHSEEYQKLWASSILNRFPLIFTRIVRVFIAVSFLFYICNYLARFNNFIVFGLAFLVIGIMVYSDAVKKRSITLERMFLQNLRGRDIAAQVSGKRKPLFEGSLSDRDIHIGDFEIPDDSTWGGRSLQDLQLRNRFGVHVSSVLRGSLRINIPNGDTIVFPGDHLQVIGDDEQLQKFNESLTRELMPEDPNIERRVMELRQLVLTSESIFVGKSIMESGIRDRYNCMVVGVEEGQRNLTMIDPQRKLEEGDVLWVVGELADLQLLLAKAKA